MSGVWFGEPWDAPVSDDEADRVETPVGERCLFCEEEIREGDRGEGIGVVGSSGEPVAGWVHAECMLRQVMGGPGHLLGVCSCCGGDRDPDLGMGRREAAWKVWEMMGARRRESGLGDWPA